MSHDADIINAYRAQLQKIRDAYKTLNAQRYWSLDDSDSRDAYDALGDAIDSMEAQTIEDSARAMPEEQSIPDVMHVHLGPEAIEEIRRIIKKAPVSLGPVIVEPVINGLRFSNRAPHREE